MRFIATSEPRPTPPALRACGRTMHFGERAYIMGVVNVTPDSFSDGGKFLHSEAAIEHALALAEQGADIIDVGGESTRPGAEPVEADAELERVIPVIEALHRRSDAWISVDTYKSEVAARAVEAGAHLINDISGLGMDDQMASTVAEYQCGLVLMHIRDNPRTMQDGIHYDDVIGDIGEYFADRLALAESAGIETDRIILDPGIGFGKTVAHNYRILRELAAFTEFGHPLLVGSSRKSFIGAVTGRQAEDRAWGTAATVAGAIMGGADIVRVHDVAEMIDVVRVSEAICAMGDARPD